MDLAGRIPSPLTASVALVDEVTSEYGYETQKLVISDRNPTAFTYGSGRYNARIVVTEGCFEYLDDELASVQTNFSQNFGTDPGENGCISHVGDLSGVCVEVGDDI